MPATIARPGRRAARRADRRGGRPGLRRPRPREARRARPAGRRRPGAERRHDGVQHRAARRRRGHRRLRHRRARRGAPARGDTFDESADLTALSRTSIVVVCAGVKSILDVPATLERLESLSVTVVGYRTTTLPRLLRRRLGLDAGLVGRRPGRRRRPCSPPGAGSRRAPSSWPTRCRWTSSSTRTCTTASSPSALAAADAGRRPRQGRHAVRARPPAPGQRGRDAWRSTSRLVLRNAELAGADRRRRWPRSPR